MPRNPSPPPSANDDGGPLRDRKRDARLILLIAAVALAGFGLLSLVAVLLSAWAGADPWPGFMTAAYFFLPLGFLLMIVSLIVSVISRGRG
ncbi:hypothetical protein [uncultured Arthrobacter sp.]|uniref:hypothetical protein n=1 Tax=uncultured Arthrobacter sp. TaxID=114050 RepID=UPI00262FE6A8|nr:hypothetical protein [uncultured Arthrobacter sp.]